MTRYVVLKINGKSIREHRVLIEKKLGRKLKPNEIVHHKNGDGRDNRLSNLKITTRKQHNGIHNKAERKKIKCFYCKKEFEIRVKAYKYCKSRGQKHFYCSKHCLGKDTGHQKLNIDNLIKKGLKKGWTGYKIAKVHGLNRNTIYNHMKDF